MNSYNSCTFASNRPQYQQPATGAHSTTYATTSTARLTNLNTGNASGSNMDMRYPHSTVHMAASAAASLNAKLGKSSPPQLSSSSAALRANGFRSGQSNPQATKTNATDAKRLNYIRDYSSSNNNSYNNNNQIDDKHARQLNARPANLPWSPTLPSANKYPVMSPASIAPSSVAVTAASPLAHSNTSSGLPAANLQGPINSNSYSHSNQSQNQSRFRFNGFNYTKQDNNNLYRSPSCNAAAKATLNESDSNKRTIYSHYTGNSRSVFDSVYRSAAAESSTNNTTKLISNHPAINRTGAMNNNNHNHLSSARRTQNDEHLLTSKPSINYHYIDSQASPQYFNQKPRGQDLNTYYNDGQIRRTVTARYLRPQLETTSQVARTPWNDLDGSSARPLMSSQQIPYNYYSHGDRCVLTNNIVPPTTNNNNFNTTRFQEKQQDSTSNSMEARTRKSSDNNQVGNTRIDSSTKSIGASYLGKPLRTTSLKLRNSYTTILDQLASTTLAKLRLGTNCTNNPPKQEAARPSLNVVVNGSNKSNYQHAIGTTRDLINDNNKPQLTINKEEGFMISPNGGHNNSLLIKRPKSPSHSASSSSATSSSSAKSSENSFSSGFSLSHPSTNLERRKSEVLQTRNDDKQQLLRPGSHKILSSCGASLSSASESLKGPSTVGSDEDEDDDELDQDSHAKTTSNTIANRFCNYNLQKSYTTSRLGPFARPTTTSANSHQIDNNADQQRLHHHSVKNTTIGSQFIRNSVNDCELIVAANHNNVSDKKSKDQKSISIVGLNVSGEDDDEHAGERRDEEDFADDDDDDHQADGDDESPPDGNEPNDDSDYDRDHEVACFTTGL